ncbi:glycosyltransferase family 2 protein [Clostridium sp. YIM B02555]|uniref:glycosyltransferase family 2 protein n=1 Tax=Clostridium sp. YIM B02555 TaxID=2911968 RepID=UPI001EEE30CF|nr:glycosyltransferase family 2 protein [Clostridium sp. YIM B02555]
MVKASIIITIYNKEKYLHEAIESALNQTMNKSDYEILLVNNGSEDGSREIAEKYVKENSNIRLINQDNRGIGGANNTGIRNANGKYICILHADDLADEKLLDVCCKYMEQYELDFINFPYHVYNNGKKAENFELSGVECEKIYNGKEFFKRESWTGPEFAHMFNRNFLIKSKLFFDESVLRVDFEFSHRLFLEASRTMYINYFLYTYRTNSGSISYHTDNREFINTEQIVLYKLYDLIEKNNSDDKALMSMLKKNFIYQMYLLLMTIEENVKLNIEYLYEIAFEQFSYLYKKLYLSQGMTTYDCLYFNQLIRVAIKSFKIKIEDEIIIQIFNENIYEEKEYKIELLKQIPFENLNKRIAIYGIGEHTYSMLKFYNENIGKINSELSYIDSFKGKNGERFNNKNIINIEDVCNYEFDYIIISSLRYEDEMFVNLKNHINKSSESIIFRLYKNLPLFYYPLFIDEEVL